MIPIVKKAAKAAGSVRRLAKLLKLDRGTLYQWKAVPAVHVATIEEITKGAITRYEMRPDVFGHKPRETPGGKERLRA